MIKYNVNLYIGNDICTINSNIQEDIFIDPDIHNGYCIYNLKQISKKTIKYDDIHINKGMLFYNKKWSNNFQHFFLKLHQY